MQSMAGEIFFLYSLIRSLIPSLNNVGVDEGFKNLIIIFQL